MRHAVRTWRFVRRWWPVLVASTVIAVVGGVAGLVWFIESSACSYAQVEQQRYPGDQVDALIQAVQDEQRSLHERNRAVWALGRFRDERALPVLQTYYTGEKCRHDKFLCQHELKKAIDLCSGRSPAPGWLEKATRWAFPKVRTPA